MSILDPTPNPAEQLNMQQQPLQQGSTSGALGGVISDVSAVVKMISNYHTAKMNQAATQVQRMQEAAKAGYMPDPKAFTKAMKTAGVPLISGPDASALVNHGDPKPAAGPVLHRRDGGPDFQADPVKGEMGGEKTNAFNLAAITDVKARQQRETELQVDGVLRQAVQNARLKGSNEQDTLKLVQEGLGLKRDVLEDKNMTSLGKLMTMAGIEKFGVDATVWGSMDAKHKAGAYDVAAGMESQAQKVQRGSAIASTMFSNGNFGSMEDAQVAGQAIASGQPIPEDVAARMTTHPLSDLMKASTALDTLMHMGLSGGQAISTAKNFSLVGLSALPKEAQNLYKMEAESQRISANASAENAGTERMSVAGQDKKGPDGKPVHIMGSLERGQTDTFGYNKLGPDGKPIHVAGQLEATQLEREAQMKKVEAALNTQDGKEFLRGYAEMQLNYRAGKVPQTIVDAWNKELVERAGGTVTTEEVKHWFKPNEERQVPVWSDQDDQPQAPGTPAPGQP